jgi:hypothetical protein
MKTLGNYLNIKTSRNFERNVLKYFPKGSTVTLNIIDLYAFAGYGQYKNYLYLTVNGEDMKLSLYHTNAGMKDYFCSEAFDNLSERTQDNYIKGCVLCILEANANYLK